MSTQVTVAGITMNTGVADGNGLVWTCMDVDGWDSPKVNAAMLERTLVNGSTMGRVLMASRALTIVGAVQCTSEANVWTARNYLAGLALDEDGWVLSVSEPTPKSMRVYPADRLRMRTIAKGLVFQIQVVAPDPSKYGTPVSVPNRPVGAFTLTQDGNFEAGFSLVAPSTTGNFTLTNTSLDPDQHVTVNCGAGHALVMDFNLGNITVDGVGHYEMVTDDSEWFKLGPGATNLTIAGSNDTSFAYSPAWL